MTPPERTGAPAAHGRSATETTTSHGRSQTETATGSAAAPGRSPTGPAASYGRSAAHAASGPGSPVTGAAGSPGPAASYGPAAARAAARPSQSSTTAAVESDAPVRVLLADDQALMRGALRVLVESEGGMAVVGEAKDGAEAVALARVARPHVVLMDIRMPGTDGISATREITADPALTGVAVLVLTTFEADEYVAQAILAGAAGFLGKGAEPDELLGAIRTVAAGDALLSPAATKSLIARFVAQQQAEGGDGSGPRTVAGLDTLTVRERQVLVEVAGGLSNDAIAQRLGVSPLTVKTHINHMMAKLATRDRAQLVVAAYESGLVRPQR